jgi:hypothetical protein
MTTGALLAAGAVLAPLEQDDGTHADVLASVAHSQRRAIAYMGEAISLSRRRSMSPSPDKARIRAAVIAALSPATLHALGIQCRHGPNSELPTVCTCAVTVPSLLDAALADKPHPAAELWTRYLGSAAEFAWIRDGGEHTAWRAMVAMLAAARAYAPSNAARLALTLTLMSLLYWLDVNDSYEARWLGEANRIPCPSALASTLQLPSMTRYAADNHSRRSLLGIRSTTFADKSVMHIIQKSVSTGACWNRAYNDIVAVHESTDAQLAVLHQLALATLVIGTLPEVRMWPGVRATTIATLHLVAAAGTGRAQRLRRLFAVDNKVPRRSLICALALRQAILQGEHRSTGTLPHTNVVTALRACTDNLRARCFADSIGPTDGEKTAMSGAECIAVWAAAASTAAASTNNYINAASVYDMRSRRSGLANVVLQSARTVLKTTRIVHCPALDAAVAAMMPDPGHVRAMADRVCRSDLPQSVNRIIETVLFVGSGTGVSRARTDALRASLTLYTRPDVTTNHAINCIKATLTDDVEVCIAAYAVCAAFVRADAVRQIPASPAFRDAVRTAYHTSSGGLAPTDSVPVFICPGYATESGDRVCCDSPRLTQRVITSGWTPEAVVRGPANHHPGCISLKAAVDTATGLLVCTAHGKKSTARQDDVYTAGRARLDALVAPPLPLGRPQLLRYDLSAGPLCVGDMQITACVVCGELVSILDAGKRHGAGWICPFHPELDSESAMDALFVLQTLLYMRSPDIAAAVSVYLDLGGLANRSCMQALQHTSTIAEFLLCGAAMNPFSPGHAAQPVVLTGRFGRRVEQALGALPRKRLATIMACLNDPDQSAALRWRADWKATYAAAVRRYTVSVPTARPGSCIACQADTDTTCFFPVVVDDVTSRHRAHITSGHACSTHRSLFYARRRQNNQLRIGVVRLSDIIRTGSMFGGMH